MTGAQLFPKGLGQLVGRWTWLKKQLLGGWVVSLFGGFKGENNRKSVGIATFGGPHVSKREPPIDNMRWSLVVLGEQSPSPGPVAVSVAASNWFAYNGGIFDDCDNVVNHAVALYGYGKMRLVPDWPVASGI